MKLEKIIFISCLFSASCSLANPDYNDKYLTLGIGISHPTTKVGHYVYNKGISGEYQYQNLNDSYLYSLGFGKSFGNIRTELEYINIDNSNYKQSYIINNKNYDFHFNTSSEAFLFNLNYDLMDLSSNVNPYIISSIGLAHNKLSNSSLSNDKHEHLLYYKGKEIRNLALGIGIGSRIQINQSFAFDLSYRYLDLGKIKGTNRIYKDKYFTETSNINVNSRFRTNIFMLKAVFKF
jgi:opacity protein-like surface antigen